ncbi:putative plasma membrane proteolipid protein [Clavispora lusitaniae]|uniref:Plasma membrane proteolipid protein n=1 Tax=Clavispora lusitaniae TaxID=36911 RepID=A0ACD0WEA8_CLALS|nr:putative plasma membrane proteolipid protein [Clavispora lusitaniae]QFZ31136.1 putative plasma membrane proteolipid protein [Clavispora lusitaniae]QFZ36804.1 putative plasma membrane proteolipid protein [Clavispora lusitaniae]QFZ42488.1 putative plasma membrane proteolipid protein [Clavispora lusitaniae]QFZ48164.1 putative plasma membrane proteolipid protein [Clavispora lusitaniae]
MACLAHTSCSPSTTPVHHKYIWARPASTKIFSSLFLQVFYIERPCRIRP